MSTQAINYKINTRAPFYLALASLAIFSYFARSMGVQGLPYDVIFVGAVAVLLLLFSVLDYKASVLLFVILTPFHFLIKVIYPSLLTDVWRELFVLVMLMSYFLQLALGKMAFPKKNILNYLILSYLVWGVIEIFNSPALVTGIFGFRYMYGLVPLYFLVLATLQDETDLRRYLNPILVVGTIIAAIGLLQVILIGLGLMGVGTYLDFSRIFIGHLIYRGHVSLLRPTSVFINPNHLADYLLALSIFPGIFYFFYKEDNKKQRTMLIVSLFLMFFTFITTLSRSCYVGMLAAIITISLIAKKMRIIMMIGFVCCLLVAVPFTSSIINTDIVRDVFLLSDPYFKNTLNNEGRWAPFFSSPIIGHGYSIAGSAAQKLDVRVGDTGIAGIGVTDMHFYESVVQVGLIGYVLHMLILLFFLKNAYLSFRNKYLPRYYQMISLAVIGAFIGVLVASVHTSPWSEVGFAPLYYVFGAMTTFIYQESLKNKSVPKDE